MRPIAALPLLLAATAHAQPGSATWTVRADASVCHAAHGAELCRTRQPVPGDTARSQLRWTVRVDGATWTRVMPDVLPSDVPAETWTLARRDADGDGTAEVVVARTPVWDGDEALVAPTDVWTWQPSWPDAMRYQTVLFGEEGRYDRDTGRRDDLVDGALVVREWQFPADIAAKPLLVSRRYRVRPGALDPTGEVRTRVFTDADDHRMRHGAALWIWRTWMARMTPATSDPVLWPIDAVRTTALRLDTTGVDAAVELGYLALGTRTPLPADAYNGREGDVRWLYLADIGSAQDVGFVGRLGLRRADGRVDYWPLGYRAADVAAWLVGRRADLVESTWRDADPDEAFDAVPTMLLHLHEGP